MKQGNQDRVGKFSSSSIHKLMSNGKGGGFGAPAKTYIQEKKYELLLGRALENEKDAKPTSWGLLNEQRVFDLLPTSYVLEVHKRYEHPSNPFWCGSPDIVSDTFTGDIKCPFTLKSFCEAVDSFGDVDKFKEAKPEWYWQITSNCILTGKSVGEIVVYCPYQKELQEIRDAANLVEGQQNKYAFINYLEDDQLPYLVEGKHYKNLNIFRFDIPKEDIDFLTQRVVEATELLKQTN